MKKIGDLIIIEATGDFAPGIECIVTEMDGDRVVKAKAVHQDDRLGKVGFILEDEEWVIVEWRWSNN